MATRKSFCVASQCLIRVLEQMLYMCLVLNRHHHVVQHFLRSLMSPPSLKPEDTTPRHFVLLYCSLWVAQLESKANLQTKFTVVQMGGQD